MWSDAAAKHLARSQRYSGAVDIELAWTVEAVNDIDAANGRALRLYTEGRTS